MKANRIVKKDGYINPSRKNISLIFINASVISQTRRKSKIAFPAGLYTNKAYFTSISTSSCTVSLD